MVELTTYHIHKMSKRLGIQMDYSIDINKYEPDLLFIPYLMLICELPFCELKKSLQNKCKISLIFLI